MKKTYTHAEVVELVRKAYEDAADALRPWVLNGPHVAIQDREKEAVRILTEKR